VVKVREPRQRRSAGSPDAVATEDDVMGLRGSVRLVAKQQRRREGRATRSRRTPVVTEAEFLARRESVERVMVVRQTAGRTQIGVLEDGVLVEHYVNRESSVSYVGNVYLGKVQNVLPSMEAAFVDINKGRNAVLYAGEVNFDAAGLNGQPRRIESALKSGQSVLVQVTKDPIGHKGARLTSQISLPGRFLVYIPGGSMMGISRKLPDTERARLKQILKKVVPEDGGVIVRTAAEGASEQELSRTSAGWSRSGRRSSARRRPPARPRCCRRAGPDGPGGPRHLQRGLQQADRLRRRPRTRPCTSTSAASRRSWPSGSSTGPATPTCSRSTGSTSSSRRRWTARCGCPAAARW
jgi:ribonuclease E